MLGLARAMGDCLQDYQIEITIAWPLSPLQLTADPLETQQQALLDRWSAARSRLFDMVWPALDVDGIIKAFEHHGLCSHASKGADGEA
jgi:hypothetical protein